jgi:hypothetical protein
MTVLLCPLTAHYAPTPTWPTSTIETLREQVPLPFEQQSTPYISEKVGICDREASYLKNTNRLVAVCKTGRLP